MQNGKMQKTNFELRFHFHFAQMDYSSFAKPGSVGEIACLRQRKFKAANWISFVDCKRGSDEMKGAGCALA